MEQSTDKESHKLALFDFDGTLTREDTMFAFVKFAKGSSQLFWSFVVLGPMLFLYKIGRYPAEKAKKRFLKLPVFAPTSFLGYFKTKPLKNCISTVPKAMKFMS